MVKERVLAWARNHLGRLPDNILFYRDGVSESQYDIIRRRELPQIQQAMNEADLELKGKPLPAPTIASSGSAKDGASQPKIPKAKMLQKQKVEEEDAALRVEELEKKDNVTFKLTFIIVGKRDNTRFYPTRKQDFAKTANSNVRPGLAVDQVITHPFRTDFYLQSHMPIQGTGRSAHYVVLRNTMGLTITELQDITHTLCYVYARATKGVSYCAPAYYAGRLCDRGRAYLRHFLIKRHMPGTLPQKVAAQTPAQYNMVVRDVIEGSYYCRPHQATQPSHLNPWHTAMDNMMFYL